MGRYDLSVDMELGQEYTITAWGELAEGQALYIAKQPSTFTLINIFKVSEGVYSGTFTFFDHPSYPNDVKNKIAVYNSPSGGNLNGYIEKLKLEKGTKPTDWTPAPEDQVSDWATTDVNNFSFIKNKPTKLSQFSNVETAFINKTQSDGWYPSLTNFNSHVNNKSNPHGVTTAQIGAVNLTSNQTIGGVKSFTSNAKFTTIEASGTLTALGGNSTNWNSAFAHISVKTNPHDVTKAQVGLGNVTNESKATMFTNPTFTGTTKVTILELNTNWKFIKVGNNIELQYDGVTKQIMTDNGDIIATAGVTAYE